MATRQESVRVSLIDDFTSKAARIRAATALMKDGFDGLDGTHVGDEMDRAAAGIENVGTSSRRSGPEIDKYSGRLRLLTDAAVTLGPALIPLGASAIPALTGALAGLGATASAVGATILAFQGIGDGLKAIDAYQLDPTVENFHKMRIELDKLGPSGAEFVKFIDNLEPQLTGLQNIARAGIFPGLEDGITELLTRLPQVKRTLADLSDGMGDLARSAGESLAGPKFTAFFNYVETDARPTLEAFARSLGNVAEGAANLFVAFAPLSRDFTGGLENATKAFAEWSRGLNDNQGFQEFLAYIRRSGPQVVAFASALADAFVGLVQAAAPFGSAVLPVLTQLARLFALIARSPIGPPLYTAAAALIAFNRAASLTNKTIDALVPNFAKFGGETETMRGKLAALAPVGVAAGLAVGTFVDQLDRMDSSSRSSDTLDATVKSVQDLQDAIAFSNLGKYTNDLHIDLARLTDDLAKNGAQGEYVQQVLEQLQGSTHGAGAAFKAFLGEDLPFYTGNTLKSERALSDLNVIIGDVGDGLGKTPGLFGGVIDSLKATTAAAEDLSGALSELNGWLDKRQALRDYRASVADLGKALKDGFQAKDAETIDKVGRAISQVAAGIKNPKLQADFLAGARASLADLANKSGPKARAQVDLLIGELDKLGLTNPKPKLTIDSSDAMKKAAIAHQALVDLNLEHPNPRISADGAQAEHTINAVRALLRDLNGDTATTYVRTIHTTEIRPGTSVTDPHAAIPGGADGMTVPGKRQPYGDKLTIRVAPGEEIISNRFGQADRFRADRAAGRIPGYADGGTVGRRSADDGGHDSFFSPITNTLKAFQDELEKATKALDREKTKLESLTSARDSLAGSTSSALLHDPFGNGLAGFNVQVEADTNDANAMLAALKTLVHNGLDPKGALFQALAASGDVNTAQQMAALTSSQLFAEQAAFGDRNTVTGQVGHFAGQQAFGDAIKDQTKATHELRDQVRHLNQAIKQMEHAVEKGAERGAHSGSRQGTKEGNDSRDQHAAAEHRAGRR